MLIEQFHEISSAFELTSQTSEKTVKIGFGGQGFERFHIGDDLFVVPVSGVREQFIDACSEILGRFLGILFVVVHVKGIFF